MFSALIQRGSDSLSKTSKTFSRFVPRMRSMITECCLTSLASSLDTKQTGSRWPQGPRDALQGTCRSSIYFWSKAIRWLCRPAVRFWNLSVDSQEASVDLMTAVTWSSFLVFARSLAGSSVLDRLQLPDWFLLFVCLFQTRKDAVTII